MKGGMLKPDTFSEHRLPGIPPGIYALLITFNRFHNYVAEELERINGSGRFGPNPRLSREAAERKIDKDLFNAARLWPLRQYHLSGYTRTILNLNYAPDSSWVLDPRESFSQVFDKVDFPVSTGNQVSVEFNLIYRWHSNVSVKDEKCSQDLFQKLFPGQDVPKLLLRDFLTGLSNWREDTMAQEPEYRTFAGLNSFAAPSSTNLPCQLNYQCAAVP